MIENVKQGSRLVVYSVTKKPKKINEHRFYGYSSLDKVILY